MKKNRKLIFSLAVVLFIVVLSAGYVLSDFRTSPPIDNNIQNNDMQKYVKDNRIDEFEEKKSRKQIITLAATGDIMFHTTQLRAAYDKASDTYDFNDVFNSVRKYIEPVDIAIANFETVTGGSEYRYRGFPTFNSPKETLEAIKNTGFDILSTANNHSIDMGKQGIIRTIDNINEYGMINIGTYKEPIQDILIKDVKGVKIAFLSYTYGCNGLEGRLTGEELSYMVNIIDEKKIENDIKLAEEKGSDIVTVIIHWGNEYQRSPSSYQVNLAKKMIEWGADIILGSHPHVIQNSEVINYQNKDKFIIYSMGNFISNQRRETLDTMNKEFTEDGVIVSIKIEKDFINNETIIQNVEYIPTWVYRYKTNEKYKYEILPVDFALNSEEDYSTTVMAKLTDSYQNTMELMYTDENNTRDDN